MDFTASIIFHSYVQPAKFESGADAYIATIIAQVLTNHYA